VLQDYGLLPDRNVWHNVAFACQVIGLPRREMLLRLPLVLEMVGMIQRCEAYPHELSGGEQQRVAIARALIGNPSLLLADEPTGNLDPQTAQGILDVLSLVNQTGTTVIAATHDKAGVDRLRRRVVALENGRIVRDEAEGEYGDAVA
jgi:cell division transport system ATP-binding protein